MIDFSQLKKRGSNLKQLQEQIEKTAGTRHVDERIFKPGFDAKASPAGYAVVRFIPNKDGQTFVKTINYGFNGKGGWYNETSPKTESAKNEDPVAMVKAALWNMATETCDDSYKTTSKKFNRTEQYYANVYVIKDTITPANEGKVMIYKFGYSIFKKIEAAAKPEYEDDEEFDPFDMWNGCNLKIKVQAKTMPDARTGKQISVPNYEESEFAKVSELFEDDDAKKEEIFNLAHNLDEFTKFKDFAALAKRFKEVYGAPHTDLLGDPVEQELGALEAARAQHEAELKTPKHAVDDDDDGLPPFVCDEEEEKPAPEVKKEKAKPETVDAPADEDPLARFKRLAGKA